MNFNDTKTLLDAISNIECFTKSMQRQMSSENTDWDEYEKCEKWTQESKQVILDLFTSLAK